MVATMVTSVGPYPCMSRTDAGIVRCHIASRSGSMRSPPTMTSRREGGRRPARVPMSQTSSCQNAVGRSRTVTRHSSHLASSAPIDVAIAWVRRQSVAPLAKHPKISSAAVSKLSDANCRMRSSDRRPYSATALVAKLTSDRCSIITPFGDPDDPDV